MVYMPITSSTNDMYGGHRVGDNLFSQSIVAVDVETGQRIRSTLRTGQLDSPPWPLGLRPSRGTNPDGHYRGRSGNQGSYPAN